MKVIFFSFLLSFPILFYGQWPVTMGNAKLKYLVRGIENDVEFCFLKQLKDIKVEGGRWEPIDSLQNYFSEGNAIGEMYELIQNSGMIIVIPDCEAKEVQITLVDISGVEYTTRFYLKSLPLPHALFAGKKSGDTRISRGELSVNSRISVQLEPDYFMDGISYSVLGFNVDIARLGNKYTFHCHQNSFSGACTELINEMQAGDSIVIYEIQIIHPCGIKTIGDRIELITQ
jgi:hypothetical protein